MPMPEPIGEPSGITATQPSSASCRASTGSSLVLGSTRKPTLASTSSTEPRASGLVRRSATVVISVPAATRARSSASRLEAPPVPITSREPNLWPAITSGSSTLLTSLGGAEDLEPVALGERGRVPGRARHHRAVEGHRDAAPPAVVAEPGEHPGDGRVPVDLDRVAVDDHGHAELTLYSGGLPLGCAWPPAAWVPASLLSPPDPPRLAEAGAPRGSKRRGENGAIAAGVRPPVSSSTIASALTGVSRMPLR